MAESSTPVKKEWELFECTFALRECLKAAHVRKRCLKKAVLKNNLEEVRALLEGRGRSEVRVNKRWGFYIQGCTFQVPPLCVAICHRNRAMMECLMKHGANPNRTSLIYLERSSHGRTVTVSGIYTPLMFALQDHESESLPFDRAVASALVQGGADINSAVCSGLGEAEEEGGRIQYDYPTTMLLNIVRYLQPSTVPGFRFLLDHGAIMFHRDAPDKYAVLQSLLGFWSTEPEDNAILAYAKELIRFARFGYDVMFWNMGSEFLLLVEAWAVSRKERQNADETLPQRMIHFLLDAGYECCYVEINDFKTNQMSRFDQCMVDKVCGRHVYSLKQLCRLDIRRSVTHVRQLQKLKCLPKCLIEYLMFAEI